MQPLIEQLEDRVSKVMSEIAGESVPAVVKLSQNPKFGDYQINGVMGLAKKMGMNPRQLADKVVTKCDLSDICDDLEIAGPGFINLRLKTEWMIDQLAAAASDGERIGSIPNLMLSQLSLISPAQTWPRKCTSAIYAVR